MEYNLLESLYLTAVHMREHSLRKRQITPVLGDNDTCSDIYDVCKTGLRLKPQVKISTKSRPIG